MKEDKLNVFLAQRPRLLSMTYQMLGTVHEAEEVLQEVYIQWHDMKDKDIREPKAMLTTMTVRRATDVLRKVSRQREHYVGPWVPAPLITEHESEKAASTDEPHHHVELSNALSLAFMSLFEMLSPSERAVYILRHCFDFPYREIAEQLTLSEQNARQLFKRAQQRMESSQKRFESDERQHLTLLKHFQSAIECGDIQAFSNTLAEDVVLYSDGGGKAIAALRPIFGEAKVCRLLKGLAKKWQPLSPEFLIREINGAPGLLWLLDGKIQAVVSATFYEGRAVSVYVMRNPDKIGYLHQYL